MATKREVKEAEVLEVSAQTDDVEEVAVVKPVIAAPPKVVVESNKMVTVTSKISGDRFIAGKWYALRADKDIQVPEHVKKILRKADAIYI